MNAQLENIATEPLAQAEELPSLTLVTCGSVDDGKSTLLGRLLYDSQILFEDQRRALEATVTGESTPDFASLFDGLLAEREQGITIDVAYRYFSSSQRRYRIADCPGHQQYTGNMASGASQADIAVILVDATKGLLAQTFRHTRIVAMMGVRDVVLAVNKMDLVDFSDSVFSSIADAYQHFVADLGLNTVQTIPVCAQLGDNVVQRSNHMPWYLGPSVLSYLDSFAPQSRADSEAAILPVQLLSKDSSGRRWYAGRLAAGTLCVNTAVEILPSRTKSIVAGLMCAGEEAERASKGDSVAITFAEEVDVARGDVLQTVSSSSSAADSADMLSTQLVWFGKSPLVVGRRYAMKVHYKQVSATISEIQARVDIQSGAHEQADELHCNDIGIVTLQLSEPVVFQPYAVSSKMGGLILIDLLSGDTLAAGMIQNAVPRTRHITWQNRAVTKQLRAQALNQKPVCLWLTGLSGAGKSTLANALEQRLFSMGKFTYVLDGDNLRHGLNRNLGFSEADRVENIRRIAEVAKVMVDAGMIVLVACISPFQADREYARGLFESDEFIEVFLDCPLEECERRDTKGLYAKARAGEIRQFTGIDSPYENPHQAELHIDSMQSSLDVSVEQVFAFLAKRGVA